MDLPNKDYSDELQFNINSEQYVYASEPLGLAGNLQPNSTTSNSTAATSINPFNTIPSFNEYHLPNAANIITRSSRDSAGSVTYSNANLLLSISDDSNNTNQQLNTVEFISDDSGATTQFKYVVASDTQLLDSYQPNVNAAFDEQPAGQLVVPDNDATPKSNIQSSVYGNGRLELNTVELMRDKLNESEVIMQMGDGQIFRQVQNIFVGPAVYSSELIPTNIPDDDALPDISYLEQNDYHSNDSVACASHEFPSHFADTNTQSDQMLDQLIAEAEARLLFDDANDGSKMMQELPAFVENKQIQYSLQNQRGKSLLQVDRDHERMVMESAISPLLAAASEFVAREEQFQSYLNKTEIAESDCHTIDHIGGNETMQFNVHTTSQRRGERNNTANVAADTMSKAEHVNLVLDRSGSINDEYVDINEMRFIHKEDGRPSNKTFIVKRLRRKKTTKRKDEELLIVDKQVPSRALATLPTNYLYFENQPHANNRIDVLAKRDIPLRTKFGPFEGDLKASSEAQLETYRKDHSEYPLLFPSPTSYLDVSNENVSNWMRFVRLASDHQQQNVLLCEIDKKLYFKSCKFIKPKHELCAGYSREYAEKYKLPYFSVQECGTWKYDDATKPEVNSPFTGVPNVGDEVKASNEAAEAPAQKYSRKNTSLSPVKSKHCLDTGAIRQRRLELSRSARTTGPTVRYACCYCSKVFSKFLNYKKHTKRVHSVNIEHKRVTVDAEHKRLTIEDSTAIAGDSINGLNGTDQASERKQWFVCQLCQTSFKSDHDLENHHKLNCDKRQSLSVQCNVCQKFLQTPSALTMHLKSHSMSNGIFECPFCNVIYQSTLQFREHVKCHIHNGFYSCIHCDKKFAKYAAVRKHMRMNHSTVRFVCHECGKCFKSKYKLKEHSLSHSEARHFLCDDCGRQFKRKDKLREHVLRVHAKTKFNSKPANLKKGSKIRIVEIPSIKEELNHIDDAKAEPEPEHTCNEASPSTLDHDLEQQSSTFPDANAPLETDDSMGTDETGRAKFHPKVPPTEYQRFIYKCHDCRLGFKRRGMLVNHMAKRHPDIEINSIHELSLPILKTERCFFCQYCDKVYKSSTKRKAHILKNHPGKELPLSTRNEENEYDNPDVPNASYSRSIRSTTTNAFQCDWCHKQYASHTRLYQHKRKDHANQEQNGYASDYFRDHMEPHFQLNFVDNATNISDFNIYNASSQLNTVDYGENKLLKLSSAALEASIRDELSFLNADGDIVNATQQQPVMSAGNGSVCGKVDVNFRLVGDEFTDTSANTLPQLFEEIDCMSLKPAQFSSTSTRSANLCSENSIS